MRTATRFRDNSKWRTFTWCSACFPSFWSRLQTIVDKASSSVFRKQNATQVATQKSPWTRFASMTLLSVYSHILTWFWAVLLTTRVTWIGRYTFGCVHWSVVGEVAPQYLRDQAESGKDCHWSSEELLGLTRTPSWWFNSVKKDLGNIFEGWWFFCHVFIYCWLLSWRTKLKLTPCTKLADTKWRTSRRNRSQNGSTELD